MFICHGFAEHCQRYDEIAQKFVAQKWFVFSHDHGQYEISIYYTSVKHVNNYTKLCTHSQTHVQTHAYVHCTCTVYTLHNAHELYSCDQIRGGTIYRDTFPAIRIAILYFTIAFFCFFFKFFFQLFSFMQKRDIIISRCDFSKVIPQIHSYFMKIICEISVETN